MLAAQPQNGVCPAGSSAAINLVWQSELESTSCLARYSNVWLYLALAACFTVSAFSQDAREIVRRSVGLDQANWLRMADYTWVGRLREHHFYSYNRVASEHQEAWETIILNGQPFRRMLERDGKPLPAEEQRKQEQKLDKANRQAGKRNSGTEAASRRRL